MKVKFMKTTSPAYAILVATVILSFVPKVCAQGVEDFRFDAGVYTSPGIQSRSHSFDGYTNHWEQSEWTSHSARGLFLLSQPTAQSELNAMESEIGNQLLLEELDRLRGHVQQAVDLVRAYNLHRGLAGVVTNFLAVTSGK